MSTEPACTCGHPTAPAHLHQGVCPVYTPKAAIQPIKTHEIRVELTLETPGGPVRIGGKFLTPAGQFSDPSYELGAIMGSLTQINRQMEDNVRKAFGMRSKAEEEEHRERLRRSESLRRTFGGM